MASRFAALAYCASSNVGDEIQTIAAESFLPRVDAFLDRDRLTEVGDERRYFLIMNGWFGPRTAWPPSNRIEPLFVSFFPASERLIGPEHREYFLHHEPIGCRSLTTMRALEKIGVEAYFSGCLTLTLENEFDYRTNDIYMVDVKPELERFIPDSVRQRARRITHTYAPQRHHPILAIERALRKLGLTTSRLDAHYCSIRNRIKHELAADYLRRYATAKLVLTSRLHCALPCLAFGTPLLFLFDRPERKERLDGLYQLMRHYPDGADRIDIDWENPPPNPTRHLALAEQMRETCLAATAEVDR